MTKKYRVHEVAKDLGLASKDVLLLLEGFLPDEGRKHMTALSDLELDMVFEHYTSLNAVENLDSYFSLIHEAAKKRGQDEKAKQPEAAKDKKPKTKTPQPKETKKPAAPAKPPARPAVPSRTARFAQAQAQAQASQAARPAPAQSARQRKPRQQPALPFGRMPAQGAAQQSTTFTPNAPFADASQKPAARRVDMRNVQVNLDKYNERYEQIAPTNLGTKAQGPSKQKFTGRAQRGKPFRSRREQEAEKLRRLELERQRRQKLEIMLPDELSVGDLALRLKVQAAEIIRRLIPMGIMASISDVIDYDTAALVAMDIGAKVEREVVVTIEERLFDDVADGDDNLIERSPVVVVMGHVDHGKTSLLDAIRDTQVTEGEAGGITQHIGAYQVKSKGRLITFLDTPGHAAFTSMRARGARVTDIAVLVVAADDGVMPQTVEAINHAKAAEIPIIVAINKIDKPEANPERVKQALTEHGLVVEEWGGDTISVPISAKTGENIESLLEMIQLVADTQELRANPNRLARGTVIEARLDRGRGPVATVLVQNGTLKTGDMVIAGTALGRVRVMLDDNGQRIEEAPPSTPAEITGLSQVPAAGDPFNAVEDERLVKELVDQRRHEAKQEQFGAYQKVTLDNLFSQISQGERKELPIIVKGDVDGSVEAVRQSLEKLSNEEVDVRVIHGAVGAVSESDVMLANASNAIIIGFNVRADAGAKESAERENVDIRYYRVIYDAINEVQDALKGMLAVKTREKDIGRIEVRQVYKASSVGTIAGCYVLEGKVTRQSLIRVVRDGIIIADDKLASLKRFKDDAREVVTGYECGITLSKFSDIKEGDIFEAYELEEYQD
jgi:translation initiation factor IF-2